MLCTRIPRDYSVALRLDLVVRSLEVLITFEMDVDVADFNSAPLLVPQIETDSYGLIDKAGPAVSLDYGHVEWHVYIASINRALQLYSAS